MSDMQAVALNNAMHAPCQRKKRPVARGTSTRGVRLLERQQDAAWCLWHYINTEQPSKPYSHAAQHATARDRTWQNLAKVIHAAYHVSCRVLNPVKPSCRY